MSLAGSSIEETPVKLLRFGAPLHSTGIRDTSDTCQVVILERKSVHSRSKSSTALLWEMVFIIEFHVELLGIGVPGRRRHIEQLAIYIVLQDVPRRSRYIRLTKTLRLETSGSGISAEELLRRGNASTTLLNRPRVDMNTVDGLKEALGDSLGDESNRSGALSHLVNGQNTVADQISFRSSEVREDETGTVTEDYTLAQVDSLEVLCFTRRG